MDRRVPISWLSITMTEMVHRRTETEKIARSWRSRPRFRFDVAHVSGMKSHTVAS
jgi:hypothetical protein